MLKSLKNLKEGRGCVWMGTSAPLLDRCPRERPPCLFRGSGTTPPVSLAITNLLAAFWFATGRSKLCSGPPAQNSTVEVVLLDVLLDVAVLAVVVVRVHIRAAGLNGNCS